MLSRVVGLFLPENVHCLQKNLQRVSSGVVVAKTGLSYRFINVKEEV
jgi:hypothetical protein